jgi:hypothetical protein
MRPLHRGLPVLLAAVRRRAVQQPPLAALRRVAQAVPAKQVRPVRSRPETVWAAAT